MVVVRLTFPSGRYHANPWGRHVNEGLAEWPPAPYRLLRALFDTWKRKCGDIPEARVESLLTRLAERPPEFWLPPALPGHTRSYLSQNQTDASKKSLVFDGFVAFDAAEAVEITWRDLELTPEQAADLATLLSGLNYLGRSESWVSAECGDSGQLPNCQPAGGEAGETVAVACALAADEYVPLGAGSAKGKGKGAKKATASWLEALTTTTTELRKAKASGPPAMKIIEYTKPIEGSISRAPRPVTKPRTVQAVLYALDATVLPLVENTVGVAERVREALMAISNRENGGTGACSLRFSGKTADGTPLKLHQHCFYLPQALNGTRRRVDHVLVCCRSREEGLAAFSAEEVRCLMRLRRLRQFEHEIDLVPVLVGSLDDVLQSARMFVSASPFVPVHHYREGRGDWEEWVQDQIRLECGHHGLPEPVRITRMPDARWRRFRRNREDEKPRFGEGFRLEFAEEVRGPFSLGYACHFGLGLFEPVTEE